MPGLRARKFRRGAVNRSGLLVLRARLDRVTGATLRRRVSVPGDDGRPPIPARLRRRKRGTRRWPARPGVIAQKPSRAPRSRPRERASLAGNDSLAETTRLRRGERGTHRVHSLLPTATRTHALKARSVVLPACTCSYNSGVGRSTLIDVRPSGRTCTLTSRLRARSRSVQLQRGTDDEPISMHRERART